LKKKKKIENDLNDEISKVEIKHENVKKYKDLLLEDIKKIQPKSKPEIKSQPEDLLEEIKTIGGKEKLKPEIKHQP